MNGNNTSAFNSVFVDKNLGFIYMPITDSMLDSKSSNYLQLGIIANKESEDKPADRVVGPIVKITNKPVEHYPAPPANSVSTLGIAIGLPLGLGVPILFVIALMIYNRTHAQKIRSLKDMVALTSKRRGYGVGKSRRQRAGSAGPIRLEDEVELARMQEPFRDDARNLKSFRI